MIYLLYPLMAAVVGAYLLVGAAHRRLIFGQCLGFALLGLGIGSSVAVLSLAVRGGPLVARYAQLALH